jgi:hypothetical protein
MTRYYDLYGTRELPIDELQQAVSAARETVLTKISGLGCCDATPA